MGGEGRRGGGGMEGHLKGRNEKGRGEEEGGEERGEWRESKEDERGGEGMALIEKV